MTKMYKVVVDEGTTKELDVTLTHEGEPLDLTDCSFRMRVSVNPCSTVTLLDIPSDKGSITVDPLLGKVLITIFPEATCGVTWSPATYVVEMTDSQNRVTRIMQGNFVIVPGGICG